MILSSSRLVVLSSLCNLLRNRANNLYQLSVPLNQINLGESRVLPQGIFLLSTLLFQLQDPLFQPVNNLKHISKMYKINENFFLKIRVPKGGEQANAPHFLPSSCPLNYEHTQIPEDKRRVFKALKKIYGIKLYNFTLL